MNAAEVRAGRARQVRNSIRIDDFGCWIWTGKVSKQGYGMVAGLFAHRLAYEVFVGPIPSPLVIDHTCHDPDTCVNGDACPHRRCVNPAHMEVVTQRENWLRGAKGLAYRRSLGLAA